MVVRREYCRGGQAEIDDAILPRATLCSPVAGMGRESCSSQSSTSNLNTTVSQSRVLPNCTFEKVTHHLRTSADAGSSRNGEGWRCEECVCMPGGGDLVVGCRVRTTSYRTTAGESTFPDALATRGEARGIRRGTHGRTWRSDGRPHFFKLIRVLLPDVVQYFLWHQRLTLAGSRVWLAGLDMVDVMVGRMGGARHS